MRKERPWRNLALVVIAALLVGFIASQTVLPHEGHTEVRGVSFTTDTERLLLGPIVVDPETDIGTLDHVNTHPNITMLQVDGQASLEDVRGDGRLHGVLTVVTPDATEKGEPRQLFSCTTPTGIPLTTPTCDRSNHGFAGKFLHRTHVATAPDKVEYETESEADALRWAATNHTRPEHLGDWTFRFDVEREGETTYGAMEIQLVVSVTKYQGKVTSWRGS